MNKKVFFLGALGPFMVSPLIISSCSQQGVDFQAKAFANIALALEKTITAKASTLLTKKASEVKIADFQLDEQTKHQILYPSQNFGFTSQIQADSIAADDQNGQLSFKVLISRGNEKQTKDFTLKNFKTTNQAAADALIKPEDYFNVSNIGIPYIEMNTKNDQQVIGDFVKQINLLDDAGRQKKLEELIEIKPKPGSQELLAKQGGPFIQSLLKQELRLGLSLKFNDFEIIDLLGVPGGIRTRVQLVDNVQPDETETISSVFVLDIIGFKETQTKILSQQFLDRFVSDFFSSLNSPIANVGKVLPLASTITTKEALQNLISDSAPNLPNTEITFQLVSLVPNSQNDQVGSLRATFNFTLNRLSTGPADTPKEFKINNREVTLFGFEIKV